MSACRRSLIAAVCAGLMSCGALRPGQALAHETPRTTEQDVAELAADSARANDALMRGDMETYARLIGLTDDFTLMSPFGGEPTHGRDVTPERMAAMGRFFRNGSLEQEIVQTYRSLDLIVLVVIERAHVEVGGLPAQNWPLRVTIVYRREGDRWLLAHRHADPLVGGISLRHAAALARGAQE